ncbi:iron complex outermembrane recepter protein [Formivibrio citricus]|uniref:Iron complex outermembrane recepter protein n=1 Tax=Formivibrio citricus TaxID=83765 RepID=A0A1I5AQY4_9NEIS|nr:TonB-dependent receptor [Formivibrio citricus]SFN64855.1 iron complex outermembrane recepter protein [Formivibrio citricus]
MPLHTLSPLLERRKKRGKSLHLSRLACWGALLFSPLAAASLEAGKLIDLPLEELLKIEVVSASRFAQSTTEAPATVAVIEEDELRQHGYRNLAEALVTVPGVYSSNDHNYTYLGVRGFNRPGDYGTRILLLTDGARRNDPLYDQALFGNEAPIEIDWVKRLEFVSGPASAVYGPNALFGTVNTVMLEGGDINGARASLDAGTWNTQRFGLVAGQKLEGERDWFLGLAAYQSGGENFYFPEYHNGTSNGRADGLDGERYHKAYAKFRWGNWRLAGNFSSRTKDLATAPWGTMFGADGTWNRDTTSLIELRYDGDNHKGWQPSFRAYRGGYRYDGSYRYETSPNSKDRATAEWLGSEFHLAYTGFAQHKLMAGVDAQWNTRVEQVYYETDPRSAILDTNNPSRVVSVFAQDEWRFLPEWLLNLSLRHDKHSDYSGVTSPRAALIWNATPRLALKAMLGNAYRFPNAYERFYHDGNVTQSANPNLKPEQIHSRELSATYRIGQGGRVGASFYDNDIRNLIDQVTDSSGVSTYTNLGKVRARGVELDAENRWSGGYRLRGSVSWQRSKLENGGILADSPKWLGKLVADVPLPHGWIASGEMLGVAARDGNNGAVPGYGIVNLKLSSARSNKLGQVSIAVYNIGNRRYYAPTNAYLVQHAVEQPRRQFMLRATLGL